jgi:hypothetical protein
MKILTQAAADMLRAVADRISPPREPSPTASAPNGERLGLGRIVVSTRKGDAVHDFGRNSGYQHPDYSSGRLAAPVATDSRNALPVVEPTAGSLPYGVSLVPRKGFER